MIRKNSSASGILCSSNGRCWQFLSVYEWSKTLILKTTKNGLEWLIRSIPTGSEEIRAILISGRVCFQ